MAKRKKSGPIVKKPKKVNYELIKAEDAAGALTYAMLNEVVKECHDELRDAKIALAWNKSWKPDVDGRLKLVVCKRASDLDRELVRFGGKRDTVQVDFLIVLNKSFWMDQSVSDDQRRAVLDHGLAHAALKHGSDGEPVEDERGRKVYRLRKPDVVEFASVIGRRGTYTRDLEMFASALRRCRAMAKTLFDDGETPEPPPANRVPPNGEDAAEVRA